MNFTVSKLAQYFQKFPGIGPRQASRFVFYLLNTDDKTLGEISHLIFHLKKNVIQCEKCKRFFENDSKNKECGICRSSSRDKSTLLVVEKDIDLDSIEKAGFYGGLYFVLGGAVPILGKVMPKEIKMKELFERAKKDASSGIIKEIILAASATPEGDNTSRYIEKIMEPLFQKYPVKISRLGRGLSTGTELEYADRDTLKSALESRK